MNHISHSRKWRVAPAMTLGLALFLTGCEELLQVDLPGTITTSDLDNPNIAEVLVNSVMGQVECSYSRFITGNPAGMSDIFLRLEGDMQLEYQDVVDGSGCGSGDNFSWFNPFQEARFFGEDVYGRLTDWTSEELSFGLVEMNSREQMLGITALYVSVPFIIFGEHLCEVTFEKGPLFDPDAVLGMAEQWATTALGHIQQHIIDFQIDDGTGTPGSEADAREMPYGITDDMEQMAYALRARIRASRGNFAEAAQDAAMVDQGFEAIVTRDGGNNVESERQNHSWAAHFFDNEADVAGPVDWWIDPTGGTNPGGPWPVNGAGPERLIPFTGYRDLSIIPAGGPDAGRAVDAAGNAVTLTTDPASTLDDRVDVIAGTLSSDDPGWLQQKYTAEGDDIVLVGWQEMILIRAEAAATDAEAIVLINVLRADAGLPLVAYGPTSAGVDEIENMIIEEARRALFMEGRFWARKIRNQQPTGTKLWFPRELEQQEDPEENILQGGVRQRMSNAEFDLNDNITRSDRATRCDLEQQPVNPNVE